MVDHLDSNVLATLQDVMEAEYPVLLDTFLTDSEERLPCCRAPAATATVKICVRQLIASRAVAATWGLRYWRNFVASWKRPRGLSSWMRHPN